MPGIMRGKTDLITRVDATLRSGVIPTPRYVIAAAEHEGSDVAVIRVESGDYPPYVYIEGGVHYVVVRSNDQSVPAKLSELEALFARRRDATSATMLGLAHPSDFAQSGRWVRLSLRPDVPFRIRPDRRVEQIVVDALREHVPGVDSVKVVSRSGHHSTFAVGNTLWVFSAFGQFSFRQAAVRTLRHSSAGVDTATTMADIVPSIVVSAFAAASVYDRLSYAGPVSALLDIDFDPKSKVLASSAADSERIVSLADVDRAVVKEHGAWGRVGATFDSSELRAPAEWIAGAMLELLRDTLAVDVEGAALVNDVERLAVSLRRASG
jgi:hypothetical protein